MEIERVQRWVMSGVLMTVTFIFAGGMALLSATPLDADGARPGLLVMAAITGVVGLLGVRVIHAKSLVTPWLLLGLLPAVLGWLVTR